MIYLAENKKSKLLKVLTKIYPRDLSIGEIAKEAKLSRMTVSTYLKVLDAEGKIEVSRRVGKAVFYRQRR